MRNKISMSTLRGFSVEDSVRFAIECGFEGIEIQTDYLNDDEKTQEAEIKNAINRGLNVSLHAPCGDINISALNKGIRRESVAQVKRAIDLGEKYSLRVVTFHPGRLSSLRENIEDKWLVMLESVYDIAEYAKSAKVFIALENMELRKKELVLKVEDLNRFDVISRANEFLGVTLDFSHFATNKNSVEQLNKLCLPVYNVHLSQCVGGKPHFPLFEDGEVHSEEVASFLASIGYSSNIVLELKSVFDVDIYKRSLEAFRKL